MVPRVAIVLERAVAKSTVRVKIYPYSEYEEIDRNAAKHIFRLLQNYNYCLEDPTCYQERWAVFWPSLSDLERKTIVLLVMTNAGGNFAVRVEPSILPVDFEPIEGLVEYAESTPAIEVELKQIVGRFNSRLVTREEITARMTAIEPKAYEALLPLGGALLAYEDSLLLPHLFAQRAYDALLGAGIEMDEALRFTRALDTALDDLMIEKEVYGGVWPE